MSLAFDAVSTNSAGNVSSLSWSHTMASGSDRLMVVALGYIGPIDNTANVSTLTYNNVALSGPTARITNTTFTSRDGTSEFYKLAAPSTGTNTVSVTMDQGGCYITAGALTYTGASSTLGNTNTASGSGTTNGSPTVASSSGNRVLDVVHIDYPSLSVIETQTKRFEDTYFGGYIVASQDAAGASSVVMNWSWTNSSQWTWSGVEIVAAGGGTSIAKQPYRINQAVQSASNW